MSKELAVVVIHGMGSQEPSFAQPMIVEINDWVDKKWRKDSDRIAWSSIYWQDVLEPRQLKYFRDARRQGDLDAVGLRKFVLTALGDAVGYQKVESKSNSTYKEVHDRVASTIKNLYEIDLESTTKPLVIVAHSLGGHIMSNYIWDMQHGQGAGLSKFEQMQNLSGIVTFGCNIPLFTFAYRKVVPIKFPPRQLSDALKARARWLNFYDPDDILGYPLKAINAEYRKVVSKDTPINVGGIFTSWNPLSHTKYWTDNDFTKPVSKFIASFL